MSICLGHSPTVVKEKFAMKDGVNTKSGSKSNLDDVRKHQLEDVVSKVSSSKQKWMNLSYARKAELLIEMLRIFSSIDHEAWARESLVVAGYHRLQPDPLVATEMIVNTRVIARDLETLVDVFCHLRDTGKPPSVPVRNSDSNNAVANVFPRSMPDRNGLIVTGQLRCG